MEGPFLGPFIFSRAGCVDGPTGFDKIAERFWTTRMRRPQGEGQDGPSQSHPLRHLICSRFNGLLRSPFSTANLLPNSGDLGGRITINFARFSCINSGNRGTLIGNCGAGGRLARRTAVTQSDPAAHRSTLSPRSQRSAGARRDRRFER